MKVLAARVDPMEGWDNPPELEILVDKLPKLEEFRFEKQGPFYFAELDGLVRFFYYREPGNGFAGHRFHIRMKDGTEETLIGPWSSNSIAVAKAGFPPTIPVAATDDPEAWERGYTFYAYHMTIDKAKQVLREFGLEWDLMPMEEEISSAPELDQIQARVVRGYSPGMKCHNWTLVKVARIPSGSFNLVVELPYGLGELFFESTILSGGRRVRIHPNLTSKAQSELKGTIDIILRDLNGKKG